MVEIPHPEHASKNANFGGMGEETEGLQQH